METTEHENGEVPRGERRALHQPVRRTGGADRDVAGLDGSRERPGGVDGHGRSVTDADGSDRRDHGAPPGQDRGTHRPRAPAPGGLAPAGAGIARQRSGAELRPAGGRAAAGRRRGRGADDRRDARGGRVGGARAADPHALVGARRPARGVDRRHAVDRSRRRAQLALRLARAPVRGGRRGRGARRTAARGTTGRDAAGTHSRRVRRSGARPLAGVRIARELGVGRDARLLGRPLRRVVWNRPGAHRLPAGDRGRGVRRRESDRPPARALRGVQVLVVLALVARGDGRPLRDPAPGSAC